MNLPQEIVPALQGIIPSTIATCNAEGKPNVTILSQVYRVDDDHVALSHQFFTKTYENIRDHGKIHIQVVSPTDCTLWLIRAEFEREETAGPIFEQMDMQLEAIASMSGMQDVFKLHSALICKVTDVVKLEEAQRP
ncbi:MAG: pyridoxamine 5'-phosphate oxidase family protein, partial [Leptospiraceae bacterium]|nr:pyridoxamine 5'-phosphate oxidase family protein [Leptospiraceae bacterium]